MFALAIQTIELSSPLAHFLMSLIFLPFLKICMFLITYLNWLYWNIVI